MEQFSEGWDEAAIEAALLENDPDTLLHVPIIVSLNPPDCAWAERICLTLASHTDAQVRANAILGFGHLARVCGALDEAKVRPIVEAALKDADENVRGQADAAASDINHFLDWNPPFDLTETS